MTLGGAVAGYRSFSSVLATADTCAYLIEGISAKGILTGAWERGFGTLNSATSFTRTVVLESSAGTGVPANFATGVQISCPVMTETSLVYPNPGGRLSLSTTAVPADVMGSSTLYYVPYLHDRIALWTGTGIVVVIIPTPGGVSLPLSGLTAGAVYDVFGYYNPSTGQMVLETLVWTNLTTRATALNMGNSGFLVKSTDFTRRYLGSFYAQGTNTLYDYGTGPAGGGPPYRHLWNMYNRVQRHVVMTDNTASWSYAVNTWRIMRGQTPTNECVTMVRGLDEDDVLLYGAIAGSPNSGGAGYACFSLDSATATTGPCSYSIIYNPNTYNLAKSAVIVYTGMPGLGYHYLGLMENSNGTQTNHGQNWGSCGIWGSVWC